MKVFFTLLLIVAVGFMSCAKEGDIESLTVEDFTTSQYIKKILSDSEGNKWIITGGQQTTDCLYCPSNSLVDGMAYFSGDTFYSKINVGVILDAEISNKGLLAITPLQVLNFSKSIQSTVIKNAAADEIYKLMDKDISGKYWILSNKSIFNLEGEIIPYPNAIKPIDFEISSDNSFWIASTDTIYHVSRSKTERTGINTISGKQSITSSANIIYNLKIDKNNNVWINTSGKVLKFGQNSWSDVKAGNYVSESFKTIPFMDIDNKGRLWFAEKNYQAFTTLHYFDSSYWYSYKLDPPINNWINDVESVDDGFIWIATNSGLLKYPIK